MTSNMLVTGKAISGLGALIVLLARSVVASACTLPQYEQVFVPHGTVPADGFAAEIGDPSRSMPVLLDDAGMSVKLVSTQGPATRWTVRSAQPLAPGAHYTFRFQLGKQLDPTDGVPQSIELTAGPSAPPPEISGTLQVQADPLDATSRTQFFHVQWNRAPAVQAYASLLEIHFLVDGQVLSTLTSSEETATVGGMCDSPQPTKDSCGDIFTSTAGRHTVSLTARLFGSAAPLPAPSVSIDMQCDPHGCTVAGGSSDAGFPRIAVAAALVLSLVLFRRKRLA